MATNTITLGYRPRKPFIPFHNRAQRFAVLVCHRRAGKTVCTVNDLVARALHTIKKDAFYGYVCPTFTQAKKVAWKYLKGAVANIPGVKINESECSARLTNGSTIQLFGADNPDSLRGLYFDGIVLDEFGDMAGRVYSEVVRPAVADRQGWVVFIGTPRGKNSFYEKLQQAIAKPQKWYHLILKASESGLLPQSEIEDMKEEMDEDEIAAELECSFDAAIKGAYLAKWVNEAQTDNRITHVPHIQGLPVESAWDLGRTDTLAVWFWQVYAGQVRNIGYFETSQMDILEVAEEIDSYSQARGFRLGKVWLPHDAKAKVIGARKSVIEQLLDKGFQCHIVPDLDVRDGIDASRQLLKFAYFDANECAVGIERLKNYQRAYDPDRQVYANSPKHDISSHGADAFRYEAIAIKESDLAASLKKPTKNVSPMQARAAQESNSTINKSAQAETFCLDDLFAQQELTEGYIHI